MLRARAAKNPNSQDGLEADVALRLCKVRFLRKPDIDRIHLILPSHTTKRSLAQRALKLYSIHLVSRLCCVRGDKNLTTAATRERELKRLANSVQREHFGYGC